MSQVCFTSSFFKQLGFGFVARAREFNLFHQFSFSTALTRLSMKFVLFNSYSTEDMNDEQHCANVIHADIIVNYTTRIYMEMMHRRRPFGPSCLHHTNTRLNKSVNTTSLHVQPFGCYTGTHFTDLRRMTGWVNPLEWIQRTTGIELRTLGSQATTLTDLPTPI